MRPAGVPRAQFARHVGLGCFHAAGPRAPASAHLGAARWVCGSAPAPLRASCATSRRSVLHCSAGCCCCPSCCLRCGGWLLRAKLPTTSPLTVPAAAPCSRHTEATAAARQSNGHLTNGHSAGPLPLQNHPLAHEPLRRHNQCLCDWPDCAACAQLAQPSRRRRLRSELADVPPKNLGSRPVNQDEHTVAAAAPSTGWWSVHQATQSVCASAIPVTQQALTGMKPAS